MNPIALIEATGAARSGVLGALARDPEVPSRTTATPVSRANRLSASTSWRIKRGTLRRWRDDERCPPVAQSHPPVGALRGSDR
jgi:hypothetical protein